MRYNGIIISSKVTLCYEDLISKLYSSNFLTLNIINNKNCGDKTNINYIFMEKKYSINMNDYYYIVENSYYPVIILSDFRHIEVLQIALEKNELKFMSILVNETIDYNIASINVTRKRDLEEIRRLNKKYIYKITTIDVNTIVNLINELWDTRCTGGMYSEKIITLMMDCGTLIRMGDYSNVKSASYDLSLGDEYFYGGVVGKLDDRNPFIRIEPYDYVIASSKEIVDLPLDVAGRFDVSVNLFCQGVILSNSTQVDPGFTGKLFCLLFNTSNKTIYLVRGMHYTTIEFVKLIEPSSGYNGKYAGENSIVPYLPPNVMQGAINELKQEIEQLKNESKKLQNTYLGVLALVLALISILLVKN